MDHSAPFAFPVFRQHAKILTATVTTCGECGSSKTVAWYNSPDVPGVKVCMKCYNDNLRQDNHTSKKKKK